MSCRRSCCGRGWFCGAAWIRCPSSTDTTTTNSVIVTRFYSGSIHACDMVMVTMRGSIRSRHSVVIANGRRVGSSDYILITSHCCVRPRNFISAAIHRWIVPPDDVSVSGDGKSMSTDFVSVPKNGQVAFSNTAAVHMDGGGRHLSVLVWLLCWSLASTNPMLSIEKILSTIAPGNKRRMAGQKREKDSPQGENYSSITVIYSRSISSRVLNKSRSAHTRGTHLTRTEWTGTFWNCVT